MAATVTLPGREQFQPKLVFMDCDGIIFDSNAAKLAAFEYALQAYPAGDVERFLEYCKTQGGISRYEKLRYFFSEVHPLPEATKPLARALEGFAVGSKAAYAKLQPRAEALQFAQTLGGSGSVYVVSGSDQDELRGVFDRHGLRQSFADILGSPTRKPDHLRTVLATRGIAGSDTLFIGDGSGDLAAAQAIGAPFIFLEEMSEWPRGRTETQDAAEAVGSTWAEVLGWIDAD